MTDRADVDKLLTANRRLVRLARNDLAALFAGLDTSNPKAVRDALLEVTPALVREYGDIAATVTAEWYEELRDNSNPQQRYTVTTVEAAPAEQVEQTVRWAAKDLFGENPAQTLALLNGAVQRLILYSSRETVARNIIRDPSKPRWARVPSGAKTCAFCEVMASRGFVYLTEETAGEGNDYHDDCDCVAVVEFDAESAHIEGYDPDAMYERYKEAWNKAGGYGVQAKDVAYMMRRLYPDQYTDGVFSVI